VQTPLHSIALSYHLLKLVSNISDQAEQEEIPEVLGIAYRFYGDSVCGVLTFNGALASQYQKQATLVDDPNSANTTQSGHPVSFNPDTPERVAATRLPSVTLARAWVRVSYVRHLSSPVIGSLMTTSTSRWVLGG
jgi:hypothetical protein